MKKNYSKYIKMRKFFLATLSLLLFLLLPTIVIAQTPTITRKQQNLENVQNKKAEKLKLLEERREEIRERIQEKRATHEAKLTEFRTQRIREFWARLKKRILVHIERLERLVERIESRLAKIESQGDIIDTTNVKTQLADAKVKLANAKTDLAAADANLETVLSSNNPKEAFMVVRETIQDIKRSLYEVHSILVHVIGDIRGLRVGQGSSVDEESSIPSATQVPTTIPTVVPTSTPTQEATPTIGG